MHGESRYYPKQVLAVSLCDIEEEEAQKLARNWIADQADEDVDKINNYYMFNAGCIGCKVNDWKYVSEKDYITLKKYL